MPDIFLCYSRDDSVMMEIIRDNLIALGFNLWVDVDQLAVGTPEWERAIEQAVIGVDGILLLMSPSSKSSNWVNIELRLAQLHDKPIFPVFVTGDERNAVPTRLLGWQYADMRGRSDPEKGFRDLVRSLSRDLNQPVPDYQLRMTGAGPNVVVVNITGHVEGNVVAVGGDVSGELNVAGRDIDRKIISKISDHGRQMPSEPADDAGEKIRPGKMRANYGVWTALVGLVVILGTTYLLIIRPIILAATAPTPTVSTPIPGATTSDPLPTGQDATETSPSVTPSTNIPTFTPPPTESIPMASYPVITAANASQLQMLDLINADPWVSGIALSPDGDTLAVATSYRIEIYSLASPDTPLYELVSSESDMDVVDFNFDGLLLASAGQGFDHAIQLWNMNEGGTEQALITGHTDSIYDVAFSPDGTKLASGGYDKSVRIWDVATGEELFYSLDHVDAVTQVDFNQDGSMLASGGADGVVRVWDVASGQLFHELVTGDYDYSVSALAFSHSGALLASGSEYHTEVRLWNAQTGEPVLVLRGHETGFSGRGIFSVAFNPAGTLLASGGEDMTIRLWDIDPNSSAYGQELVTLQRHPSLIAHLIFSPDGSRLISAGGRGDGTIIVWTVSE